MTTTAATPLAAPLAPAAPTSDTSIPTALPWCECEHGCELTTDFITARYLATVGACERVPHSVVVRVTQEIWALVKVCRFFELAIEDAAVKVAGAVQKDYAFVQARQITEAFSVRWLGCPECLLSD